MSHYDLVIIGAGPAGLALAHACSAMNKKILIIDKEQTIGGCHRVKRVKDGMFTEHGPRIYLSIYMNLFFLLSEMGLRVDDIFVSYNYNFLSVAFKQILPAFSLYENLVFTATYFMYLLDDDHGWNVSLQDYLTKYGFSQKAMDILDRLCRFTDGGSIKNYTLNKLLRLQDAMLFVTIYQPKQPLDKTLFHVWKKFLDARNVDFILGGEISYVHQKDDKIEYITVNETDIYLDNLVMAAPPAAIVKLIKDTSIESCFGSISKLEDWAGKTEYTEYISITYHFEEKLNLPHLNGLTLDSDWGIALVNLTDYMESIENKYRTVLSTAISICNKNSRYIHKTANECTKEELCDEVYRQIKNSLFHDLPEQYVAIMNPNNYYDIQKNKWECTDKAYFNSFNTKSIPFHSETIKNIYNVGTQNGHSHMSYTTMESAVSNAMALACILYPNLNKRYYIRRFLRGKDFILLFLLFLVVIIIIYFSLKL